MKKRLTAILLALVLMMGLTTFAAAEEGIPTAATFDELVAAMEMALLLSRLRVQLV